MQEFNDGTFGEIHPQSELLERLMGDDAALARTKKVHFGAREELEQMKAKAEKALKAKAEKALSVQDDSVKTRLDRLERKVDQIILHLGVRSGEIITADASMLPQEFAKVK